MKLNKFFFGMLGAFALTACTSDENTPNMPDTPGQDVESRYMTVSIRNASLGTRTGGDQDSDQDNKYEEGYDEENKVKSLRFYFFDKKGEPAKIALDGTNFYTCKDDEMITTKPNMPNVEEILQAVIVINGANNNEINPYALDKMVAVANFKGIESKLGNSNLSLSQLQNIVNVSEEEAISENGFLMTSSTFFDEKGYSPAAQITSAHIKPTREEAIKNPVELYVERVVAKVRVSAKWDETKMSVKKNVTLNGKGSYTAVALKDSKGSDILSDNGKGSQVYVIFNSWDLWMTADKTNLFKKVGDWDSKLNWIWNNPSFFRSYWAENPENVTLKKFSHAYPSRKFGDGKSENDDYEAYTAYSLENAADFDNGGLKKSYSPANQTTNRTLVYLKALLVTINENNDATPLSLAEWAGLKYTKDQVMGAMFEPNLNKFYFVNKTDTTNPPQENEDGSITVSGNTSYTFNSLTLDNIQLVTGKAAGEANDESENSKRYLSYLQLRGVEEGKLYKKDGDTYKPISNEGVNNELKKVGGARVWDGGNTYYYHEIKHLGQTNDDGTWYGMVRNHIYEVELNTVTGLGTPVLSYDNGEDKDFWEDIIPQRPEKDSFFLAARMNILSWRVVPNKADLEW